MTTSVRMEEDQSHMTERILSLTLEIIYLLTGESFPPVKSRDHMTITVSIPPSPTLKKTSKKKILEVTQKMIDLLTGEEEEYGEGHKDLYKDVMEDHKTSPGGSINPKETCPLDSTIPHHHQSGVLGDYNIVIKEEFKEDDEEYGLMMELSKGQKNKMEPPNNRDPPESCPRDSIQEGHTIPHQGEDLMELKVEGEGGELYVRGDQYMEEAGITRTFIEEDTPTYISTGLSMEKPLKDRLTLSPGCKMEDEGIPGDCAGKTTMSSTMDGGLLNVDRPWNPPDSKKSRTVKDGAGILKEEKYICPKCGESFRSELSLSIHQRSHTGEEPHSCSECGKSFLQKSELIIFCRCHTTEKPHSCPDCGKCYARKSDLVVHQRTHTGEKPYSCPQCGKSYTRKSHLVTHQRSHTGEKPYSCPQCGKCYPRKSRLVIHQRSHTGEKPYSCPECGKCFAQKSHLYTHRRSHTGEKPFSCPECGKCFLNKAELVIHKRSHTGEKPYACPECGKCFSQSSSLCTHRRLHTGQKMHSCPECGKSFQSKSYLVTHQRSHTGEKPYSCAECGKCFTQKSSLTVHQLSHTRENLFPCP